MENNSKEELSTLPHSIESNGQNENLSNAKENNGQNGNLSNSIESNGQNENLPNSIESNGQNENLPNAIENNGQNENLPNAIENNRQNENLTNSIERNGQNENLPNAKDNGEQEEPVREAPLAVSVTVLDLKFFKDVIKNVRLFSLIGLVLGGILLVFYSVLLSFYKDNQILFYLSFIILVMSGTILVMFQIQKKEYRKGILIRYEFYQDHILQRTLQHGALTAEAKLFYTKIERAKYRAVSKTKGYVEFCYLSRYAKHYINLENMSVAEKENLQRLLSVQLPI